jgi:outer membrane protein, multidrug efflux system
MTRPAMEAKVRRPHVRPLLLVFCVVCTVASGRGSASPPTPLPESGEFGRRKSPSQWYAPLPHNGRLTDLSRWWAQFDDPLLSELIEAAQRVSPTIAAARARIGESRAARVASGAALGPTVAAAAHSTRGRSEIDAPVIDGASRQVQASWEIDLFGANRAARAASQARLEAAHAEWHSARVSVAAEVAVSYLELRACEGLAHEADRDALSRAETLRLTELSLKSGFQSQANAALARASAAQSSSELTRQRAECERNLKAMAALVDIEQPSLRDKLAARAGRIPSPAEIAVASVPAEALAQRPDLFSAGRDVIAASADARASAAERYPRITLNGSIGAARLETGVGSDSGTVWSVGPVAVSLPIFDGGRRKANTAAALARYEASVVIYQAKVRSAVAEVEDVLIRLQSAAERAPDAQRAASNFDVSLQAAEDRYRAGLGSLLELEEARRDAVQARIALIELERERVSAWIALYRALGGGWSIADNAAAALARE